MPRLFRSAIYRTNYLAFDRRPDGKLWGFPTDSGESWRNMEIPASGHVVKWVRKGLGDFFSVMGANAVSVRLGELIKNAAPHHVELYPIQIYDKKRELVAGSFSLLNVVTNVYAIDFENSPGRRDKRLDGTPLLSLTEEGLVLLKDKLPESPIWQDGSLGHWVFVSDELADLIEKAGIDVLTTIPISVVT